MAVQGALARALSHRNARIFFGASLTAWTGLWMHRIAVAWLAWEMTGSAFWVGMTAFCDLAPAVVVSPIAGAIADRVDRVRLAMFSQAGTCTQAGLVALLAWSGQLNIGLLLVLEVLGGIAASFSQPARQSMMPGLVPPADLPSAVAANSLCFNVARFVGPGLAGPIIAIAGPQWAIAANSMAYLIACLTMPLLRMDPAHRRGHAPGRSVWLEAAQGLSYAARHPGFGPLLLYAGLMAVLLRGVQEVLPPFVDRVFGQGPGGLAVLTAGFGVGALVAGLWLANRGQLPGTTRLAIWAALAQAAATAGFALSGWFPLGVLCGALIGASASIHGISVQILMQSASAPEMRGRMLSLWGLITRACPALGALALGGFGEWVGLRLPVLVAVALSVITFAWGMRHLPRMASVLEKER
jgi:MFS family permease